MSTPDLAPVTAATEAYSEAIVTLGTAYGQEDAAADNVAAKEAALATAQDALNDAQQTAEAADAQAEAALRTLVDASEAASVDLPAEATEEATVRIKKRAR